VQYEGKNILVHLWDTAGQERYQSISASYFRGCDGVCLVYDKTSHKSFDAIARWMQSLNDQTGGASSSASDYFGTSSSGITSSSTTATSHSFLQGFSSSREDSFTMRDNDNSSSMSIVSSSLSQHPNLLLAASNKDNSSSGTSKIKHIIVGNKSDTNPDLMQVTPQDEQKLSKELRTPIISVSAKSGENVTQAFGILIKQIVASKIAEALLAGDS